MRASQTLPDLWLLSDARNDAVLEQALSSFRSRIGFVYRHYHLDPARRRARFERLVTIARQRGHLVVLSSDAATARRWGADGFYGPPGRLRPRPCGFPAIAAAHDMAEVGKANRLQADAVLLSPVFATRSHPGARTLGALRFRLLARNARMPVIALGGMNQARARRLKWPRWAAIDGLS